MAVTSGRVVTATLKHSYFYVDWQIKEQSTSGNHTIITWQAGLNCGTSGSGWDSWGSNAVKIYGITADEQRLELDSDSHTTLTYSNISGAGDHQLASGTAQIDHDTDGEKTFRIGISGWLYSYGDTDGSEYFELEAIPRYATSVQSLKSKTSSSITMNWSSDSTIDYIWHSKNNGSSWTGINVTDGKSGSYTISGLSAGTTYKIKTRVRRKDSQLTTDSSALSVTTYKKTVPIISLSSKTVNSITVSSSCNVTVSSTKYRIKKSGGSYGSYQTSATFTGLTPNTSYVIEVYKMGKDSGETGTATLSVTTYDIARLTSYPNFNLGDDVTIKFSNPSGAPIQVGLYSTNGLTDYAVYRTVTGSSYTFKFTDEELDKIYKALENNNSLVLRFYINTNNNAYRDGQNITITLTGNQKTVHIGKEDGIKRGKVFIARSGIKRGVLWRGVNGTARRCI